MRGRYDQRGPYGRIRGQEARHGHGNYHGTRDIGINSIKVSIPTFKGESDPEVFLAWELSCEKLFQVNDLTEEKKSCYAIAHFEGYTNTWWDYTKRFDNVLIGGQPTPWEKLKRLIRERYVPK